MSTYRKWKRGISSGLMQEKMFLFILCATMSASALIFVHTDVPCVYLWPYLPLTPTDKQ